MTPALAPPVIDGPAAWKAGDLTPDEWVHTFSAAEADEVVSAARQAASCLADLAMLGKSDFPLPSLAERLSEVLRRDVLAGRGFAVIRGPDPATLDARQCAAAFLGLGAHLGNARPQNAKGHILGHVKDLGRSAADPTARLYQTHERQTFHTDSCDVVALMCLQPAKQGGRSSLVSSVTLHNEMRAARPDLALRLFDPIETDRRGEQAPGEAPFFTIPVFNWFEGHFAAIYQRQYIDSARRFAGVPPLTAHSRSRRWICWTRWPTIRVWGSKSTSGRATSSSSTITSCSTTAPNSKTGPSRSAAAICCGCGWRRRAPSRLPRCSANGSAAQRSANAAAFPYRTRCGTPRSTPSEPVVRPPARRQP